ncbi:MAG: periplasmic heavy metal sensor [Candidatus Krumholzibacteriota bacterium]|nr:periplasmic heavy metal sensor [Candidatus Krumholzibacteriota bacterium]
MKRNAILLTTALMLAAAPLAAQHRMHDEGGSCAMPALELKADQETAMEKLRVEHRMTMIDLEAAAEKLRIGMRAALAADRPDAEKLGKMNAKLAATREKIGMARIDHMLAVRKILDDEQWKIFVKHHRMGDGMRGRNCRDGSGMHRPGRAGGEKRGCGDGDGTGRRGGDGHCGAGGS